MKSVLFDASPTAAVDGRSPDEDRVFELLGNERRRSCLQRLAAADGAITVQDLATEVAELVSDEGMSPDEIRNSVYISLCQNHLPKLDAADVVEYDSAEKVVSRGRAFPAIERHLTAVRSGPRESAGGRYHFLLSVATVLVLLAALAGVPFVGTYGLALLVAVHALAAVAVARRYL